MLGAVFMRIASLLDLLYVLAAGLIGAPPGGRRCAPGAVYLALAALAAATGGAPRERDARGSLLATLALALVGSLVAAADLVEGYPLPPARRCATRSRPGARVLARGGLPRLDPARRSGSLPWRPPGSCCSTCS